MESSMQTLVFPLTNRSVRQVFDYSMGSFAIRFMYDSGARIPVWCSNENHFVEVFPCAVKSDLVAHVTGFGIGSEEAAVYILPKFELLEGKSSFVIRNLPVVILYKPQIGCDFILSETMVSKVDTFTYRTNKKELHIAANKKEYICTAMKNKGELIDISVWIQE